ncbi:MAG TPA: MFS transporter [Candidatus Lokiarchaeia archaeon]|nr:MFS transporter [Candidatus Lokiarchaeia archaeon]
MTENIIEEKPSTFTAPGKLKASLRLVYLYQFSMSLNFIGGALIPFFTMWGGITLTQVMLLQAWYMAWIFALEIPTGVIADKIGRKLSVLIGVLVLVVAITVYTSMANFYVFMAGEFLWAMSGALISGADNALVYDMLKDAGQEATSKVVFRKLAIAGQVGMIIAAPIGSLVATVFSPRDAMLFMVFPVVAAAAFLLPIKEPSTINECRKRGYARILAQGLRNFASSKPLQRLVVNMVIVQLAGYCLMWLYQVKLEQFGVSIAYFGVVQAMLVAGEAVANASYGRLEKWLGSKRRLLSLTAAMLGCGLLVMGFAPDAMVIVVATIAAGGFGLSRGTLFSSYFNKHIPSEERATTLSVISMVRTVTQAGVDPFLGVMMDWSANGTFLIFGSIALVFAMFPVIKASDLVD